MSHSAKQTAPVTSEFEFSEEARRFLLRATYGRGLPKAEDKSRMPFVLWTLSTDRIGADGSSNSEFGPRYQLFVGSVNDVTSEFVVELQPGKAVAFRLDPAVKEAASYFVSLDQGQLRIQPM